MDQMGLLKGKMGSLNNSSNRCNHLGDVYVDSGQSVLFG